MRRIYILSFAVLSALFSCKEKKQAAVISNPQELSIMFYNVENLFDIEDDPNTADEEFTPTGKKAWTADRYEHKLNQLGKVISSADAEMPDMLGLCEVENRKVVEDLIATEVFSGSNFEILHKDSPDGRGIDVAMVYNADKISLSEVGYIKSTLPVGDRPNTRLVLHAKGSFQGEELHVFVNHWPSRHGGEKTSEPNRLTVAYNVKQEIKSILTDNPEANILMMGDFNDHPNNRSLANVISAGKDTNSVMVNLMWEKHKNGEGSYNYKGNWGALDQFIVSPGLMNDAGLEVEEASVKFVRKEWMMYINKEGMAFPNRTYGGPNYYGGFSDHLPIHMKITLAQ